VAIPNLKTRAGAGERQPERSMLFKTLLRRRKITAQFKLPEPPVVKLSTFELAVLFMYRT